jgi:hypothetical protein
VPVSCSFSSDPLIEALRSALCALRSALCALRSALCALRSALCALRSSVTLRAGSILLGLLLLTSAILKLSGDAPASLGQNSVLFSPPVRMLTIEAELLLGLWLVSGWQAGAARLAALSFFGLLAAVSLWLALEGQSSCGCFGRIAIHPWVTLIFDLSAVGALAVFRPRLVSSDRGRTGLKGLMCAGVGAVVLLTTVTAGLMAYWRADFSAVLVRLRGEPLTIEPALFDLGSGVSGQGREFEIRVTNHSARPVRIVGGPTKCPCAIADELPVTVPAGGTITLPMRAKFTGTVGIFRHELLLYTDNPEQPAATARIMGTVVDQAVGP